MSVHDFAGKVAFVTGGSSGIGRRTAIAFAEAGAEVAILDIDPEGARSTLGSIEQAGRPGLFIEADVRDAAAMAAAVEQVVGRWGKLDCAFNNAGISDTGGTVGWQLDTFERTIDTNLKGVFYCLRPELEQMAKQGGGAIVNTASVAGMAGAGSPAYVGSKHGVVGLTRAAALEYAGKGIRVNCVCPGAVNTPMIERTLASSERNRQIVNSMHPLGRIAEAQEIADAVLFLCSDQARFITGHPLAIDGGFLAR